MKKILALILAVLMVASLAACGGKDDPKGTDGTKGVTEITLKVWAPDLDLGDDGWLTNRLAAFEKAHPEYKITWDVDPCSEAGAKATVTADPTVAADVYMFANDQLGALLDAGALAQLAGDYLKQVQEDNSQTFVDTVTGTDGNVYGFPMTPNTWFMYYRKSAVAQGDLGSMEKILASGAKVSFDISNGWYNGALFFGAGGTLFGANGTDAKAGMDFDSEACQKAALAMVNLYANENFNGEAHDTGLAGMLEGTRDVLFSGSWTYEQLKTALGDDLGTCALPTVEGIQMKAFAGSKAVGVNPHSAQPLAAMQLAAFLASEESQLLRYEMRNITPAHKSLASNEKVTSNIIAAAEMAVMNNCAVVQPSIPAMDAFWTPMGNFGAGIINGDVTADNCVDMLIQTQEQVNK